VIKGVLLDMDGTIVDAFSPIIRALNQTFAEYGLKQMTAPEIKRHTGRGDCGMLSLFGEHREAAGVRFLEIHDEDYLQHITPLAGAEQLFMWLQEKNIPCAIVTSKGQMRAEAQLDILGWRPWVQSIIGKIEGRPGKPDPTPVLLACEALNITPDQSVVMIGDGIADMKSASRAGALALGLCDSFSAEELTQAGAAQCFDSLVEIHSWLTGNIDE